MKVLVCGSRAWSDGEAIRERLLRLPNDATIIHGGARGADQLAGTAARSIGIPERSFPADWSRHGKRAGILRNLTMLDEGPELVLAFQRKGSRGTQHTIDEARWRGIPVEVFSSG